MENTFINLTEENLGKEHLCCIIRTKTVHPGVEAKRKWLAQRLSEGHVFRKLDVKGCVFIEYAPAETAWVPINADNYLYIYCLWVNGEYKGKGYGRQLMEYCINDAKKQGKSGICMLAADKQKAWLSDQSFAESFGFRTVDTATGGYRLLALSFDNAPARFTDTARRGIIKDKELHIYYDDQCPFIDYYISYTRKYCQSNGVPVHFHHVDTLKKAKDLPGVFNNWCVFCNGHMQTVNLLNESSLKQILKQK